MTEIAVAPTRLKGQDYVTWLSEHTLRMVEINHKEGTPFLMVDLPNQANAEASAMRDYHGRYLFELLQNANDAILPAKDHGESPSRCFRVRIAVTSSALVVANDGVPFQERDVDSIYRWGESSKDPNKSIGHKGIGFKSVLEITYSPEVFSQVVQFRFDRRTCEAAVRKIVGRNATLKLPITRFVFPYQIDDVPSPDRELVHRLLFDDGFATVIRLPLRVPAEQVWKRIAEDIQPTLLLFLTGIDRIEISDDCHTIRVLDKETRRPARSLGQDVTLYDGEMRVSRWLLFDASKQAVADRAIIRDLDDKAWERVKKVGFAVALPLDDHGCLDGGTVEPEHLFVYFPTNVATGLRYLIHGDFYIDAARKDVNDRPYNQWLAGRLASFVRSAVLPELVRLFPQDARILRTIVPPGQPEGFAAILVQAIHRALGDCPFVPVEGGEHVLPTRVMLTPEGASIDIAEFRRLFPPAELSRRHGRRQFPLSAVEQDEATVRFLMSIGARRLALSDVFRLLDGRECVREAAEYPSFYRFLWMWREQLPPRARSEFSEALGRAHCIVTGRGVWKQPHEQLYHAKLRQETPTMPRAVAADLVHPSAYDAEGRSGWTYRLLDTLSPPIRDYDAPEIIRNAIIPLFHGTRFQELALEERAEVYRYLFAYWRSRRGAGDPEVERVKSLVQVPARLLTSRRRDQWLPASQVYLSSSWSGDDRLERLYDGFEVPFLYQVRGLEPDPADLADWARFWDWLGVATMPRIQVDEIAVEAVTWERRAFLRRNHPHAGTNLWLEYLDHLEAQYGECPKHGKKRRHLRRSVALQGFAELAEGMQAGRLLLLYGLLADNWSRIPKTALEADVCCHYRTCPQYARSQRVPSFLDYLLHNAQWIPARTNVDGTPQLQLRQPRHCWFVSAAENPIVRNLLPTPPVDGDRPEHQQFCQYIGMRFIERASQIDLVEMLRHLPAEYPDPNMAALSGRRSVPRALAVFSRWVIGRINNLLAPLSAQERSAQHESVPLICLQGNSLRYVQPPEGAFFADDRYHTVRWRAHLPFAQMDETSQDAARFLGVHFISEHVEEGCDPGEPQQAETARLESRFKAARPYMLAIVKEQRESELQDAALYLSRLRLTVVDHLVVHRRLKIPPHLQIPDSEALLYLEVTTARRTGSAGRAPRSGVLYVRKGYDEHYDLMAGPIAEFVRMSNLADAFVVLLDRGGKDGRLRFLETRGLGETHVQEMRLLLESLGLEEEPEPEVDTTELDKHLLSQLTKEAQSQQPGPVVEPGKPEPPGKPSSEEGEGNLPVLTPIQFPPLDLAQVQVVQVLPEDGAMPEAMARQPGRGGGGGRPDWEKDHRLREAYGERGEQVVKLLELERLRQLGVTAPEQWVQWRREQGNFTADHDMDSRDLVDGQWVEILIEVKATPGRDFRFPMSRDELACAQRHGDRYRLYRVIEVLSSSPQVYAFGNPFTLWKQGRALIEPRDTYVVLPDPRKTSAGKADEEDSP